MPQPQRVRGDDRDRRHRITATGEDVQDDVGRVDAVLQRLGAGGLDRSEPVGQHGTRMPAISRSPSSAPASLRLTLSMAAGSTQCLNGAPFLSAPGSRQNRDVVPRVVDGLPACEAAPVHRHDGAVLADDDPLGIGVDLDRTPDRTGHHGVAVVVKAHEAGLRDRGRQRVEAIEAPGIGHEPGALGLEHGPDRLVRDLGVAVSLG